MISAFTNTFKIPELRNRVLFTLVLLVVVRIGAAITSPMVNASVIQAWFNSQVSTETGGSVAALFNIFSGGALENCAVFSLGVMPYISASIMLQLLTAVIPQLAKISKEDGGRQKIMHNAVRDDRVVYLSGLSPGHLLRESGHKPFPQGDHHHD